MSRKITAAAIRSDLREVRKEIKVLTLEANQLERMLVTMSRGKEKLEAQPTRTRSKLTGEMLTRAILNATELDEPKDATEVAAEVGCSPSCARKHLQRLVKDGKIRSEAPAAYHQRYLRRRSRVRPGEAVTG